MRYLTLILLILVSSTALSCSREDSIRTLAMVGYHEARGEGERGMRAVMEVVMVRVGNDRFPDDVCKVVYQPSNDINNRPLACAFSFTCDRRINLATMNTKRYSEAKTIAKEVYHTDRKYIGNADHYLNCNIQHRVAWVNKMRYIGRTGKHCFYKEGDRR